MNYQYQLLIEAVYGTMYIAAEGDAGHGMDALNLTEDQWELVSGSTPWMGKNMESVRATLDKVMFATLATAGYDRFEVFAEYIAGIIALVVHPVNMKKACHLYAGKVVPLAQIIRPESGQQDAERVTRERLFGLVVAVHTDTEQVSIYKQAFMKQSLRKVHLAQTQGAEEIANKAVGNA